MMLVLAFVLSQAVPTAALDVQIRPFLELYFSQRAARAAAGQGAIAPAEQLALASIDAAAIDCENADAFLKACAALPESIQRGGQTIQIRDIGLGLARQLAAMPDADRRAALNRTTAGLEAKRIAIASAFQRFPRLLPAALASLGLSGATKAIPVAVVSTMPAPGAATFRTAGGGAVSVVGVESLEGADLMETVLHEALHAADAMSSSASSILAQLRAALTDAAAAPRTAADCVHAVIFAQAAATVRQVLDPAHTPVGSRPNGAYGRMSAAARESVAIWTDRCDGKIDDRTAIARIVAAARGTVGSGSGAVR